VLLDWSCSDNDGEKLYMEEMGACRRGDSPLPQAAVVHLSRLNNRTHRKLLIVDGKVGFTGGVGIADDGQGTRRTKAIGR
jgi:cardiolipin synthase